MVVPYVYIIEIQLPNNVSADGMAPDGARPSGSPFTNMV